MTAILKISDGTNEVDLLAPTSGLHLADWKPALPQWKGGGVWMGSPLSDGRRLAVRNFDNTTDLFELKANEASQDKVIQTVRDLRALLEAAVAYWTGVGEDPVYLVARGPCETNFRYAVIYAWKTDQESNPYAQPFFSAAPLDEFALALEHGPWLENPPGTGTAVEASATQAYNGVTLGRAATTAAEVYASNKSNLANLTHIYFYDASTAAFSANLLGAARPFWFLPNPPAVGDIVYFGCATAVANSGPIFNLVFDIDTPAADLTTAEYEVGTGPGAWGSAGTIMDHTNIFQVAGVHALSLPPNEYWVSNTVNGVAAWWFRVRITAVGAAPSRASQQNRDIYAVPWAHIDIAAGQAPGDLPALARYLLINESDESGANGGEVHRLLLGLRAAGRGSNFRAYLNAADEQNPAGLTVQSGTASATATGLAPSGEAYLFNLGAGATGNVTFAFDATLCGEYTGAFRVFARFWMDNALTDVYTYLRVYTTSTLISYQSPNTYIEAGTQFQIIDYGLVSLPGVKVKAGQTAEFTLSVNVYSGSVNTGLWLYDLILIPVDECAHDFWHPVRYIGESYSGDFDSLGNPRERVQGDVLNLGTANKVAEMQHAGVGSLVLQPGAAQRLWFLHARYTVTGTWAAWPHTLSRFNAYRCARYLGLRGAS